MDEVDRVDEVDGTLFFNRTIVKRFTPMRLLSNFKFQISNLKFQIALAFLIAVCSFATAQGPEDAIIARVNGEPLLLSQLKEAALDQEIPPSALLMGGMDSPAYRKALTQVVDELLLVQHAKTQGVKPNDVAIARDVDQMLDALRRQLGSQEKLEDFLKQHHLTLSGLRGLMTERETKRALSSEIVARQVVVDDAAIEKFKVQRAVKKLPIEEVNLSQILVGCLPGERAGKRGETLKAEALKATREAGALKLDGLPDYVRRYTETHGGDGQGLSLGWLDPETLLPALRDEVRQMLPGGVSTPLESDQGYHVLVLLGRHSARDLAFIEEYGRARAAMLLQLRREAAVNLYDLSGRSIKLDLSETTPTQTTIQ